MLSMAITSAPASTRISAQSRRPSAAAVCSGVLPEAHLLPNTHIGKNGIALEKRRSGVSGGSLPVDVSAVLQQVSEAEGGVG